MGYPVRAGRTAGSSSSVQKAPSRSRWISKRPSAYVPVIGCARLILPPHVAKVSDHSKCRAHCWKLKLCSCPKPVQVDLEATLRLRTGGLSRCSFQQPRRGEDVNSFFLMTKNRWRKMTIPRNINSHGSPLQYIHFARMHVPKVVVQPWARNRAKRSCNDEFKTGEVYRLPISGHRKGEKPSLTHP